MTLTKKMTQAMRTILDFVESHNIDPENVEGLLKYMQSRKLEFTTANLIEADKALSERYWQQHPEERPAPPKWTQADVERMSSAEFKQKLTDPEFAAWLNGTSPEPKPISPVSPEPKKVHDFGADLPDADRAELQKLVEQKRKGRA
jgi:hypothetical protein